MVSVIIPTYQRADAVGRAVDCVIRQTYKEIEIIVVDDNGEGTKYQVATEQVINSYSDKRIHYIVHEKNRGGCAARNTGIINAKGDYVAFLDDDDEWKDCFIERMIPYLNNPIVGAVYCNFCSYNGKVTVAKVGNDAIKGKVHDILLKGKCPTSTSLFIVRKEGLIEAGLFDESLPSFQDYDMWLRLSELCEFGFCNEYLVLKNEGFGEQTSRNPQKRELGYNMVVTKYENGLSDADRILFQEFKEKYYYDTLYRKIVYYHDHGVDYRNELQEYIIKYNSPIDRIRIWSKIHLPQSLYSLIGMVHISLKKDYIVRWGKHHF